MKLNEEEKKVFEDFLSFLQLHPELKKWEFTSEPVLSLSDLEIDPSQRLVRCNQKEVALTTKEYNLLCLLAVNNGRVLSYSQIYEKVWGETLTVNERGTVEDRLFVFPFLGEVIEKLIKNKNVFAETVIRRAIEHNKNVYEKLSALIDDEYNYLQSIGTYGTEKELKRQIARYFKHDDSSNCVSLSIISVSSKAFVGNIIKVESPKMSSEKTMLIEELNRSYDKVISLGGE